LPHDDFVAFRIFQPHAFIEGVKVFWVIRLRGRWCGWWCFGEGFCRLLSEGAEDATLHRLSRLAHGANLGNGEFVEVFRGEVGTGGGEDQAAKLGVELVCVGLEALSELS
jgi:hypothetical protein